MFTLAFWKDALERAIKTTVQTLVSVLGLSAAFNVFTFAWLPALGVALGAGLLSLLTSVLSIGIGPTGSASLVTTPVAAMTKPTTGRHEK